MFEIGDRVVSREDRSAGAVIHVDHLGRWGPKNGILVQWDYHSPAPERRSWCSARSLLREEVIELLGDLADHERFAE